MLSIMLQKQYDIVKTILKELGPNKSGPEYLEFLDKEIIEYGNLIEEFKENQKALKMVRRQIARDVIGSKPTKPKVNSKVVIERLKSLNNQTELLPLETVD